MSEKEKRKVNPRRRLLIRLLIGIAIIVALVAVGIYALQPKGAQIVFIAPDDNGVDNNWLADLNNPEHPRQLTFHDDMWVERLQVSQKGYNAIYLVSLVNLANTPQTIDRQIWYINLQTGHHRKLITCTHNINCTSMSLNPSGVLFAHRRDSNSENDRASLYIYDIRSDESVFIDYVYIDYVGRSLSRWIDDGNLSVLVYGSHTSETQFNFYSVTNQSLIHQLDIDCGLCLGAPNFSPDGSRYVFTRYLSETGNKPSDILVYDTYDYTSQVRFIPNPPYPSEFQDWHPDNEQVLVNQSLGESSASPRQLNLVNITTGEHITLADSDEQNYRSARFNHDGSQILYWQYQDNRYHYDSHSDQIMLYDMQTREEIALPLFGRNPQWVNGGR